MVEIVDIEREFDNRFTRQFGFPKERAATKVEPFIKDMVREFIQQSPLVVMATSNREGQCDASPKGGKPGFVKILDETHLLIPDVAGNNLFQSYLNVVENPHVGLVFFIPGVRETVRVNGTARVVSKEELDKLQVELQVFNPDDNAKVQQGLLIETEETYGHCPRALAFSDFWNPENMK